MKQLKLSAVPVAAVEALLAAGQLPEPLPASVLGGLTARESAEGTAALEVLGVSGADAPLVQWLERVAQSEIILTMAFDGDELTFVESGDELIPALSSDGGFYIGEPIHRAQAISALRRRLTGSTDKLSLEAFPRRGAQAVAAVWKHLARSPAAAVTRAEAETALGLPVVDDWAALAQGWVEESKGSFSIVKARRPLLQLMTAGNSVVLSRQEGLSLLVDEELVGREGRWVFVQRVGRDEAVNDDGTELVDDLIVTTPAADEALRALVDAWAGVPEHVFQE